MSLWGLGCSPGIVRGLVMREFADQASEPFLMLQCHCAELNTKLAISGPAHKRLLNLDRGRLPWGIELQSQRCCVYGGRRASDPASTHGHVLDHSFAGR